MQGPVPAVSNPPAAGSRVQQRFLECTDGIGRSCRLVPASCQPCTAHLACRSWTGTGSLGSRRCRTGCMRDGASIRHWWLGHLGCRGQGSLRRAFAGAAGLSCTASAQLMQSGLLVWHAWHSNSPNAVAQVCFCSPGHDQATHFAQNVCQPQHGAVALIGCNKRGDVGAAGANGSVAVPCTMDIKCQLVHSGGVQERSTWWPYRTPLLHAGTSRTTAHLRACPC